MTGFVAGMPFLGDISKAKRELNWKPRVTIEELIAEMVESDERLVKQQLALNHAIAQEH